MLMRCSHRSPESIERQAKVITEISLRLILAMTLKRNCNWAC